MTMAGPSQTSQRAWLPHWLVTWFRARKLRHLVREVDSGFAPRAAKARGDERQAILSQWSFEVNPSNAELAQIESVRLRRLAYRWHLDCPSQERDYQTGLFYIPDALRIKLRREISAARRESIRWWVQVLVMPLIGLLGVLTAVLSVFSRAPLELISVCSPFPKGWKNGAWESRCNSPSGWSDRSSDSDRAG